MTDETTLVEGAGEVVPAVETKEAKAPRSDAEASLNEAASKTDAPADDKPKEEAKPDDGEGERKKNRTKEYIARINRENAELRAWRAEQEARQQPAAQTQQAATDEPTLEQFNYDIEAFQRALIKHELENRDSQVKQAESTRRQAEIAATYNQKVADFADDHPDFPEVVGSIAYPLSRDLEAAIMAHPNGPQIAYHLGNNDDDAFQLAAIQPHLAVAAVERLAKRLAAAQPTPQANPTPSPKPVSKAPAPVPTVGGRSPVEIPPEKMTDDEWYARERKRREAKG